MAMLENRFKPLPAAHDFGPTLKKHCNRIESNAQIAALLDVFFQNNPNMNTAKIPGLTTPVYSCIN
jgi:hypothetical protein